MTVDGCYMPWEPENASNTSFPQELLTAEEGLESRIRDSVSVPAAVFADMPSLLLVLVPFATCPPTCLHPSLSVLFNLIHFLSFIPVSAST